MKINKSIIFIIIFNTIISYSTYSQSYNKDFFPIGVWSVKADFRSVDDHLFNPEKAAKSHRKHFADLRRRGFNSIFLSLDPIIYTLDTILDIAEENDMKIIAGMNHLSYLIGGSNDNDITGDDIKNAIISDSIFLLKKSPATLGYYLYDEPLRGWIDFNILKQAKDSLLKLTDGNRPILSTWNDIRQMEYIESYINLDVLMADTYPFSDSTALGSLADYMPAYFSSYGDQNDPSTIGPATPSYSDYIEKLRREHCNQSNKPFWIVFQTFGDVVQYDPNNPEASWAFWRQVKPKEIRLQAWIAIMQGAKGLWYFLYESEYPALMGMLDLSGEPTIRLEEATAINSQINKISKTLLKLKVVEDAAVYVDKGEVRMHENPNLNNNNKYLIITNTDYYNDQDIKVTINKSELNYNVVSLYDEVNDTTIQIFEEALETISFSVHLDRADGSLYRLSFGFPESTNTFKKDHLVKIFPNPTTGKITIDSGNKNIKNIDIFNLLGQQIYSNSKTPNKLDLSFISDGIYIIELQIDNKIYIERLIVKSFE